MGKTSKWIRNFLLGKKEKEKEKNASNHQPHSFGSADQNRHPTTPILIPPTTPKEKRRWSFRRSSVTTIAASPLAAQGVSESQDEQQKHAMAVAAATAAAADAAVAAAQAAAASMVRLTATPTRRSSAVEEAAAVMIQSVFRGYLARKALNALKGLVKLQALVRGHLVRKQATATLRCMQALVTVQERARAQRIRMVEDSSKSDNQRQLNHRKSAYNERGMEENIKIVEMDLGGSKGSTKSRNSYSNHAQTEHRCSTHSAPNRDFLKLDPQDISPVPSARTEISPRAHSGHFEDYSYATAQGSPQFYSPVSKTSRLEYAESLSYADYPFFPNYMANTESSRAKARSQSAPKSRPDTGERPPSSRRRPSVEGRNVPRAVRMQRSSSQVGPAAPNYNYPWSIKLDRSNVSLRDSECGSTSTALTNTIYCRSLVGFDVQGSR